MIKRMITTGLLATLIMIIFIVRLAWLQLLPGHVISSAAGALARDGWKRIAVVQRQRSLVLDTGRGDFVDRYGKAMTGETYMTAALFPVRPDARGEQSALKQLAALLNTEDKELTERWDALRSPDFWRASSDSPPIRLTDEQVWQLKQLNVEGIRVLPYRNRYLPHFDAKHLIGFTSQHPEWLMEKQEKALLQGKRKLTEQVGGSGLEKSLDTLLHGIGETSVSYFLDGRNMPLHGLDMRLLQPSNSYYPLKAVTTIDLELQNKIEAYADRQGLEEGAIVVLDAANADIVAMVSRPKLTPGRFRTSDGSEWMNYALKAVEPGSIYKLVTAAAALEHGAVKRNERFHCSGHYGKYGLTCWRDGGHGNVTLLEGLAQSCNIVFATLAERMKGNQLEQTAAALGLHGRIGWHAERPFGPFAHPLRLLEEEEEGRLFVSSELSKAGGGVDGGILAQSGIGQRDVRMSPLQAANLIVTLLNGGIVMEPRIVSEIRYASGERMVELASHTAKQGKGRISAGTARTLLQGMEAVVDHGTGRSIRAGKWPIAGKSGTAETMKSGNERVHQWFAGYGPLDSPRYAVAVLAANRRPGSVHQATLLFRGVMDIIAEIEGNDWSP